MAIRTVVTRGYGNGTFSGTIALVVLRGYAIGKWVKEGAVSGSWVEEGGAAAGTWTEESSV